METHTKAIVKQSELTKIRETMEREKEDPCHTHFLNLHTYICTYIHTYIHAYIHTYIHTYVHAYIHAYRNSQDHEIDDKVPTLELNWKDEKDESPAPERLGEKVPIYNVSIRMFGMEALSSNEH